MKTLKIVWAIACFAVAICLGTFVNADEAAARLPDPLAASVLVNGCSGTVISKGEKWARILTARHCVIGNIGNTAQVEFIDGTFSKATLLAIDDGKDLALFAIPAIEVRGVAPVAIGTPDKARYESIGWPCHDPKNRDPYYFLLSPIQEHQYTGWGWWGFKVDNGGAIPGVSGSGIFANGQLVSVLARNNGHKVATECFGCNPAQIAEFIRAADRNGADKWQMGEWGAKARNFADAPPAIADAAKSNHHLFECSNGRCRIIPQPAQPQAVPPPPDAGHDAPPVREAQQVERTADTYSGKGKRPPDLSSDKKLAAELDRMRHREAALEEEVARLKASGVQGPPGDQGPPGKDFAPPPVRHEGSFLPAILAAGAALIFGKFVGFKQGL